MHISNEIIVNEELQAISLHSHFDKKQKQLSAIDEKAQDMHI